MHNLTGTAHKNFITTMKERDPIFLSIDELMKLDELEITGEMVLEEWPDLKDAKAVSGV